MGVDSIMVTGEHISQLFIEYSHSQLIVNRAYQRKLVWSLAEKQSLIETILKGYPVPLFLFASRREKQADSKTVVKREIIDGLQRLEAIVSFISNKFPVKINGVYQYYNIKWCPGADYLLYTGKLEQKTPAMDQETCNKFAQYYLAVTTIEADEVSVEDVFKRINATGRQLSPQELRQAGVISKFSSMVHRIASRIRGDYTKEDVLPLGEMEKYSLGDKELPYGISVGNVFWTNQDIMSYDGLRRSKDEEMIAHICNYILSGYSAGFTKRTLDSLYEDSSGAYKRNEELLTDEFQYFLIRQILLTFDDLCIAIEHAGRPFKSLVTTNIQSRNTDLVFIIVFLAMYQLRSKGYTADNPQALAACLAGVADEELTELITMHDVKWDNDVRTRWIERISNRLQKGMRYTSIDPDADKELCSILSHAVVEEQMYDFKLGVTNLVDGTFNKSCIEKYIKTLIAMANTKPMTKGYVILGIANDESSAKAFEKHYKTNVRKFDNLFVTGVEPEANKYYGGMDGYMQKLTNSISALSRTVPAEVISSILKNIQILPYGGGSLAVLSLSANTPIFYNSKLYIRHQSSIEELVIGSPEFQSVMKAFYSQTSAVQKVPVAAENTSFFE